MSAQHCKPSKIVSTQYCAIWQCADCESIRLQLGDLTLQLTPQQMHGIAYGLNEAVLRLEAMRAERFGVSGKRSLPN